MNREERSNKSTAAVNKGLASNNWANQIRNLRHILGRPHSRDRHKNMENIFSFWLVDIPVVVGDCEEVRSRHKIWNFRINFYIIFHSWVRDSVQSWLGRNIKYLNCLPSLSRSQSAKSPPTTLLRWHYLTRRMIRALINYPATHENCAKMSVWDNFLLLLSLIYWSTTSKSFCRRSQGDALWALSIFFCQFSGARRTARKY